MTATTMNQIHEYIWLNLFYITSQSHDYRKEAFVQSNHWRLESRRDQGKDHYSEAPKQPTDFAFCPLRLDCAFTDQEECHAVQELTSSYLYKYTVTDIKDAKLQQHSSLLSVDHWQRKLVQSLLAGKDLK